ncbi:MAG TPA: methyltransferase domain-containing protein [Spirochaetota bacterium]|nr:methyltransferase domain-containing protein [Spirochaetota bacterium]
MSPKQFRKNTGCDFNFNTKYKKFKKNICNSPKGKLRFTLVEHHLEQTLPFLLKSSLKILDAGAGLGQFALKFARMGHKVIINDIADVLLKDVKETCSREKLNHNTVFNRQPLQQLLPGYRDKMDLVLLHAVLAWLHDPLAGLSSIAGCVKKNGYLSLLLYNKHALVIRNALSGNFSKILNDRLKGTGKTFTPPAPVYPQTVEKVIKQNNFKIISVKGIRIFYDYLEKTPANTGTSMADITKVENRFGLELPYIYMGRYVHYICKKI